MLKEEIKIKKYLAGCPSHSHWQKVGIRDHHGICFPLFSIRSKNSCGIGEYSDLIFLIDFCKKINMDVLQLLPLNEVYYKDPSPYNAFSSCALDPIYLGLVFLPHVEDSNLLKKKIENLKKLNHAKRVIHDKVRHLKLNWLRHYYNFYYKNYKNLASYAAFKKQNPWLKPYSVFRTLKDYTNWQKCYQWPQKYQNPTDKFIDAFIENHSIDTEFYIFLQYLCFSELSKVKEYATKKNVLLKGDIPILINPDSVDVWYYRHIFDMSHVAGAPPDDFNFKGHKWGFPLFNWKALKKHNYFFWQQRLSVILNLYHLYRIDHAVGFFRIWAIAPDQKAQFGQFLPKDPSHWREQGEERFRMLLNSSILLPIAEDLGLIPKMVYTSLKKLGICGTKIPRWQRITPLWDYEPISLTTLSTHDTETLHQWWHSHPEDAKTLCYTNRWKYIPDLTFEFRKQILYDTHHSSSIFHINLLQEYLSLFPELIWKNPKDERINISGTIKKTNWTYKYKPSLEEMISHNELTKNMKEITS